MKTLIIAAIRCSLMFTAVTASLFFVQPGQAYTVRLHQAGTKVVANGSGAINLAGLTFQLNFLNAPPQIQANFSLMITRPGGASQSQYTGFAGPTNFGSGTLVFADTGSGDGVGIVGSGSNTGGNKPFLFVPQGYVSGSALSSSAIWNNMTLADLGVTPGIYVWIWGRERTRTSISRSGRWAPRVYLMAARQFLCSVSLCSAWLPCGAVGFLKPIS